MVDKAMTFRLTANPGRRKMTFVPGGDSSRGHPAGGRADEGTTLQSWSATNIKTIEKMQQDKGLLILPRVLEYILVSVQSKLRFSWRPALLSPCGDCSDSPPREHRPFPRSLLWEAPGCHAVCRGHQWHFHAFNNPFCLEGNTILKNSYATSSSHAFSCWFLSRGALCASSWISTLEDLAPSMLDMTVWCNGQFRDSNLLAQTMAEKVVNLSQIMVFVHSFLGKWLLWLKAYQPFELYTNLRFEY